MSHFFVLDQPAKELPNGIKQGTLSMHRKVFSIDRLSKVFGVVQENWLLLYWTNKNAKPFRTLDLELYKAKENRNIPTDANSLISFTVYCPTMSNKNYNVRLPRNTHIFLVVTSSFSVCCDNT